MPNTCPIALILAANEVQRTEDGDVLQKYVSDMRRSLPKDH
jgi:hypothetical protein